MNVNFVGRFATTELQHRRPKQGVKSHDVFADEMMLLQPRLGHVGVKVFATLFQQIFQRCQIAHRCIQPHIKILARCVGDFNAKVRRVTADVPVAQAFAFASVGVGTNTKPFFNFVRHFGLQFSVLCPRL